MKILFLQLKRIGDLILTAPALQAVRRQYPEAHLTLCIMETAAGLTPACAMVDEVLVLRRKENNARFWAQLALRQYDLCLDFTGNDRSAFISLLSKARRRITFAKVSKSYFRPLFYNEFVQSSVRERHTIDRQLDLLKPLGIAPLAPGEEPDFGLCIPPRNQESAQQLLANEGITDGVYAVIHPGTARTEKYWCPKKWATIIEHCQTQRGLPCVITGSPDPYENEHIAAIGAELRSPFRNLAGKMDLPTLAALIQQATLLVSMDSAPVHLGAVFGTRQVSLFGQTNPYHWRPRHPRAATLLAGHESALADFSPHFERRPLSDLSTETVIDAISNLF